MKIKKYQIDAFTSELFRGNPAAVCPLKTWLPDAVLQSIAAEHNLSETAFFVKKGKRYHLRWFTPKTEVDLCGHATLATAHAIFSRIDTRALMLEFETQSGVLSVTRNRKLLTMEFPSRPPSPCRLPQGIIKALKMKPSEVYTSRDLMLVYDSERQIRTMKPDFTALAGVDVFAVIVTAKGTSSDFVSRFFVPREGICEDPVTGSAHCTLIPFWSKRLRKKKLVAKQLSERQGILFCEDCHDRVKISGNAVLYSEGIIFL